MRQEGAATVLIGQEKMREGLRVEYALEAAPYLYMAKSVRLAPLTAKA